jgi:PKD repeat protein
LHGAAPLDAQFTNASENASAVEWNFQDGSDVSTALSPAHTFESAGNYTVELKASNTQGCFATATQQIQVETAFPDIAFNVMTISENPDGSLKVILTLQNNGNTLVKDLPVAIDISGNVTLRETIQETITPASQYNLVLSYGIQRDGLNFLCATADLQNDRAPLNNRICTELDQGSIVFKAYPNPVRGNLHLEWIARKDDPVQVMILDAMGKKVLDTTVTSAEGLNQKQWDTGNLLDGIYLLILKSGSIQKTQRIVISGQN